MSSIFQEGKLKIRKVTYSGPSREKQPSRNVEPRLSKAATLHLRAHFSFGKWGAEERGDPWRLIAKADVLGGWSQLPPTSREEKHFSSVFVLPLATAH